MTPDQIALVEKTWKHAEPLADAVVRLFYRRLFELEPKLRDRFCTSMSEQGDHLLAATNDLVLDMHRDDGSLGVVGLVEDFTRQEELVIDAWLWAIGEQIGRHATAEACRAWRETIRGERATTFRLVALGEVALVGV